MQLTDVVTEPMTRNRAIELGLHKYIPLKKCRHDHHSFRLTSNNRCIACTKENSSKIGRALTAHTPPMTRGQAISLKLTRYTPLLPCRNGHASARYTSTNRCVACQHLPKLMGFRPAHCTTRAEAKEKGRMHWMPAEPCVKGHLALRVTSTGKCSECVRGYRKRKGKTVQVWVAHLLN